MKELREILGFQGEHRFLSNFYPCSIEFEGLSYKSSEAAYQASKLVDDSTVKQDFTTLNAREARTRGRRVEMRPDWEGIKLNTMYRILRAKFSADPLRSMLLDTGKAHLEETNYWRDIFWGRLQW